jgi:hypothetical protein
MAQKGQFKETPAGSRFGRLVVVRFESMQDRKAAYRCLCDCGRTTVVNGVHLRRGNIRSCGCLQAEITRARNVVLAKHHHYGSPTYRSWIAMKGRCRDPKRKYYHQCGVRVCERWENSFEDFLADVGERPTLSHTIDRYPNPAGNYEPGNARWATKKEQANNKRKRHAKTGPAPGPGAAPAPGNEPLS